MEFGVTPNRWEESIRGSLSAELQFMMAFIDQQNGQLDIYLNDFNARYKDAQTHGCEYAPDGNLESVSGISSFEYDIEETFKGDLPQYIRHSQILMLWSMLEKSLNAIVQEVYQIRELKVPKKGKNKSIFIHLIECLESVDDKISKAKSSIIFLEENVRHVRNYLTHGRDRKLKISHHFLEIEKGCLVRIKSDYVGSIISSIGHIAYHI